jgi:radical SAM superfamily enzyme YgiQ (UPF0313 family)
MQDLQSECEIVEYTIARDPKDIVEDLLKKEATIVGFGVYIWNVKNTYDVISMLKKLRPDLLIVLGGPEVSHETARQAITQIADYTLQGEADFSFYEFCRLYLLEKQLPKSKFVASPIPEIAKIQWPYSFYSDADIKTRNIYVEASRGCPFRCEYCLSSLDKAVRTFEIESFLQQIKCLIDRGGRQFKFIDRTFNLSPQTCKRILSFFLDKIDLNLFLHFEMVPDRLPEEIKKLIIRFPAGSLQFEIGIQTWNPEVAALVSRKNNYEKVKENFRFLALETHIHTHADLIVGLPGENIESFASGFDQLAELNPSEIQVGILKRLNGAPLQRHTDHWQMLYQDSAPYQILQTRTMNYSTIQHMVRFSKYWDLYANSGNFKNLVQKLKEHSRKTNQGSLFWLFYKFTDFLHQRHSQSYGISLLNLVDSAWFYLTEKLLVPNPEAAEILIRDYALDGKREVPKFFLLHIEDPKKYRKPKKQIDHQDKNNALTLRQKRHQN